MASWQSRVARMVVRVLIRRDLAKHQATVHDQAMAIRRSLERGDKWSSRVPRGITITPAPGGEWVQRDGTAGGDHAVIYLHGGGMVGGTIAGYRGLITVPLARRLGVPVFAVDYRRAPEHRFPAALDDCVAAYRYVRERVPAEGIVFAGDSAGGNLVLATLLALRERDGNPRPCAGVVAMSPWTDLAATGASVTENAARDDMFPPSTEQSYVALAYADRAQFTEPLVSPLYGAYAGSPPIILFASTVEMLRDDSTRLAAALKASGVDVTLELVADMPHVWPVFTSLPESRVALDHIERFIRRCWAAESARAPVAG